MIMFVNRGNRGGHTVLHDIADDAELVKVASTALGAEGFLKGDLPSKLDQLIRPLLDSYLNIIDVVAVPGCVEELIAKAQNEDVLDHLLAQVMVNTEDLLFLPVGFEGRLKRAGALEVFAERLLNLGETQMSN